METISPKPSPGFIKSPSAQLQQSQVKSNYHKLKVINIREHITHSNSIIHIPMHKYAVTPTTAVMHEVNSLKGIIHGFDECIVLCCSTTIVKLLQISEVAMLEMFQLSSLSLQYD